VERARSLVAASPPGGFVSVVAPAAPLVGAVAAAEGPAGGPLAWLDRTRALGAMSFWDSTTSGEPSVFAGRGRAWAISARGAGRFASARAKAAEFFGPLAEERAEGAERAPSLVAIGGAAFRDDERAVGPWAAFDSLEFVVPRWLLSGGPGGWFLRLTASQAELGAAAGALDAELEAIERPLAREPAPRPVHQPGRLDDLEPEAFRRLVRAALSAIAEGGLEKVVVAGRAELALRGQFEPLAALERMRGDGSIARFCFEREGACFLGATPERLVALRGGLAWVDGVAGTAPRGVGADDDAAQARALLSSDKDLREHRHVVEAIVAALSGVCARVDAPARPGLRSLRRVHHLHTPISAAAPGAHVLELVEALHPTPAVGGLPRAAALAFLGSCEGLERGWYAGPVGWFDAAGEGSFAVAIRSALVEGGRALLYAGVGVVRGSDADLELAEALNKRGTMLDALGGGA
jgi:isochorismate synthase